MSEQETELAHLMATTFLTTTHEERVEHGTWKVIARAILAAGYERRRDVAEADERRKQVRG